MANNCTWIICQSCLNPIIKKSSGLHALLLTLIALRHHFAISHQFFYQRLILLLRIALNIFCVRIQASDKVFFLRNIALIYDHCETLAIAMSVKLRIVMNREIVNLWTDPIVSVVELYLYC